jgi:hypothetical protein
MKLVVLPEAVGFADGEFHAFLHMIGVNGEW